MPGIMVVVHLWVNAAVIARCGFLHIGEVGLHPAPITRCMPCRSHVLPQPLCRRCTALAHQAVKILGPLLAAWHGQDITHLALVPILFAVRVPAIHAVGRSLGALHGHRPQLLAAVGRPALASICGSR